MRASFEQGKSIDEFSAPEFSLYLQDKASSGGGTVTEGGSDENATLFGDAEQPLAAYGDAQTVAPAASPRLPCLSLVEMHGGMQSQAKDAFKRLMSVAVSTEEQLVDGLSDAEARAQRTAQQESASAARGKCAVRVGAPKFGLARRASLSNRLAALCAQLLRAQFAVR